MNKASGGDGIPAELFQVLKEDDAVKVLHSLSQQKWKTQHWPQEWKRSVFIPIPKKSNTKECSNYCTIALISHASKILLKILQARPQFESVNSLVLSLLYGPPLTSIHDYWKSHSFDYTDICWQNYVSAF